MTSNLRQVRYHIGTPSIEDQNMTPYPWSFCIVNEAREIARIRKRVLFQLATVNEYEELSEGPIAETKGLYHLAFSFFSQHGKLRRGQWEKIYDAPWQVHEDRDLGNIIIPADIWFPEIYLPRILGRK